MIGIARRIGLGTKTVIELVRSMSGGRYWWLVPLVLFLMPIALVFILVQTMPLVAPFVYTLL